MMTDDKIELLETVEGEEIRRYGMLICDVLLDIAQGCWIGESLLCVAPPRALVGLPLSNIAPDDIGATFQGGRVSAVASAIQSGARSRRRNDVRGGRKPGVARAAER